MRNTVRRTCTIAIAALTAATGVAQAQLLSKSKLYVGALNCNVSGSVGFIVGSTKELNCILVRPDGTSESYSGKINRFGIDIGFTKARHVAWHAYSLSESAPAGALAGDYIGSQESLTVAATAGGTALIGGSGRTIILNSVVIQGGQTGLNFADGIAEMSLARVSY